MSEQPTYDDVLHALRVRLSGNLRIRGMPARDIADDLLDNGYLPTKPGDELITRALQELREERGEHPS